MPPSAYAFLHKARGKAHTQLAPIFTYWETLSAFLTRASGGEERTRPCNFTIVDVSPLRASTPENGGVTVPVFTPLVV